MANCMHTGTYSLFLPTHICKILKCTRNTSCHPEMVHFMWPVKAWFAPAVLTVHDVLGRYFIMVSNIYEKGTMLASPHPLLNISQIMQAEQWGQRPETSILAHTQKDRQGAKAGGGSSDDWKLNIVSGFCQSCWGGGWNISSIIFQIFDQLLFIRLIRSLLSFALF